MDAREAALEALTACERQGDWQDRVLRKQLQTVGLAGREAALATQLCYGVLQNRMLLDWYLTQFSRIPLKRMEIRVLMALRLGLYQILFLDRIPARAAVDTSVRMARAHSRNQKASGMVNGILRNVVRTLDHLPELPREDPAERLSIQYSHPRWLTDLFLERFGPEETEKLLQADNSQPPVYAQANPLRTDPDTLRAELEEQGVSAQVHPWLPGCLTLSGTGDMEALPAFQAGKFYIQDPASRLAVLAAAPEPGMKVLDACAAPGGKSFAAALSMENRGEMISCDVRDTKLPVIRTGAERLGISILTGKAADGRVFVPEWENTFDRVFVDAPCSGLGVIRKKPDIRYKDPKPLEGLPKIQMEILSNASRYCRSGGTVLYSTCTLLKRENEDVVSAFLETHPEFHLAPFTLPGPAGTAETGQMTLLPHMHGTDGFFICRLQRQ